MESKHENDRLDDELMELFSAPVPSSFEEKWRSAIQREESLTMSQFSGHLEKEQKKTKRKWWKAALPAAAALVLVAGSCWVGAQQPEYGASDRSFSAQPRLYTSASDYDGGYQNEAAAYDLVGSSDESGYAKKSVSMASGSHGNGFFRIAAFIAGANQIVGRRFVLIAAVVVTGGSVKAGLRREGTIACAVLRLLSAHPTRTGDQHQRRGGGQSRFPPLPLCFLLFLFQMAAELTHG